MTSATSQCNITSGWDHLCAVMSTRMTLTRDLTAFALLCLLYATCEATYLTLSSHKYRSMFMRLQHRSNHGFIYAALPFAPLAYLCYVPAWYILCLRDTVQGNASKLSGIFKSLLFATAVYGVYNFTNKVTFPEWPISMLIQDLAWGVTCLTAVGTAVVFMTAR